MKTHTNLIILTIVLKILQSQALPTSNMVLYLPFMGNAQDQSGNNNHGTVYGATLTQDRFGNENHAYYFNGVADHIEIPFHSSLSPTNQLTITFWMKSASAPAFWDIIYQKGGIHPDAAWGIEREYVIFYHSDQNLYPCSSGDNDGQHCWTLHLEQTNNWVFYSHVIDRTAAVHSQKIQINGVLLVSQTDTYSTFNNFNNALWIGKGQGEGAPQDGQNGAIDDFRVQMRALSSTEILELYNEGNPGPICSDGEQKEGIVCKPCNVSCAKCNITANNCIACLVNNYILNYVCYAVCPDTQYQNSIYCSSCNSSCKTCSNSENQCTSCLQNNGLLNHVCQINCPDGFFYENGLCKDCNISCSKCNVSASNCTVCKANTYFLNNSCQSPCPTGQFINGLLCSLCNSSCNTCDVSENNCTSCYMFSGLLLNVCYLPCPIGYQLNNEFCLKCNNSCATCETSENNCKSCLPNDGLLNSICYSICPDKYYLQSSSCLQCNASCQNCSITKNNCTSCLSVFGFLNNSCYSPCPDGYQMNGLSCSLCNNSCKTCTETTNKCTSCNDGNGILFNKCYSICPDKYFLNHSECSSCNSSCGKCDLQENNCTSCISGLWFLDNSCYSICPEGQYMNLINSLLCSKCNNSCKTCIENSHKCTNCYNGNGILNNICYSICPDKYYLNKSNFSNCNATCGTCEYEENNCISCPNSSYGLLNNYCYFTCPDGQFLKENHCQKCNETCLLCSIDSNNCTKCQIPQGLHNNSCYFPCPIGQFLNSSFCSNCNSSCKACENNSNNCISCKNDSALLNNSCQQICPQGYYQNTTVCLKCNATCKTCQNNQNNCTSCPFNLGLLNCVCQSECPENYFMQTAYCMKCHSNCKNCQSTETNCTGCDSGLGLLNGACIKPCADGQFLSNGLCIECNKKCLTCYGPTENECRKNIQVAIQLMATIDPLIFRVLLSQDFPEFFRQFDNISQNVKINGASNYTYAISKDNNTNDIKLVLLMNQKLNGLEMLTLQITTPIELDLDPVQILGNKNASILLLKQFPTTISEETANLLGNATKITSLVTAGADTVTDLLLTFNSVPILAVGLSRLISQSKFLSLSFPTNVIVCFQKQMEEKTFWRFLDIKQNANESWIPSGSKFKQFNFSPLSWNNTNEAFFKIGIYLICYIALIFLNASKKDSATKHTKGKKEKPIQQQIQFFIYKLINMSTFSYFIVLVIAMLVNFYYVSFVNPGAIISFVIALILYWITMRTLFFSFMVHYWVQSSTKKTNDSPVLDKTINPSSFTKIIHSILLIPTKDEFIAETFKYEFLYFDYKPETLIGFLFETLSFVRYLFFASFLILCEDYPLATIVVSLIISIVIFIWIVIIRPFRNLILLIQYVLLELLSLAFFSMLFALWLMDYTNYESPDGRVFFGSAFLFLNLLLQLVPTGLLVLSSLWEGVQVIKQWIKKRNKQKKINSKNRRKSKSDRKKQSHMKKQSTLNIKKSNQLTALFEKTEKKESIEEKLKIETKNNPIESKPKKESKHCIDKIKTMKPFQDPSNHSKEKLKSLNTLSKLKQSKTLKKRALIKSLTIKHSKGEKS